MVRTECLDPNPDPSMVILLLQFRSAFLATPCGSISDSMLVHWANGNPVCASHALAFSSPAQACTGRFGSMHAARTGLCEAMPCVSSSDAFQFVRFSLLALFAYLLSLALC